MADRPFDTPLPADLPEDWTSGQIVAPAGADVGLSQQHGYNYLMEQVNAAQRALNTVNESFDAISGKRTCRFVVGTSTNGWTQADCDYLCDGVDDQVEIQAAIDAAPEDGCEIVVLDGVYNLSSVFTIIGRVRSLSIVGNPGLTVFKLESEFIINTTHDFSCSISGLRFESASPDVVTYLFSAAPNIAVQNCEFHNVRVSISQGTPELDAAFVLFDKNRLEISSNADFPNGGSTLLYIVPSLFAKLACYQISGNVLHYNRDVPRNSYVFDLQLSGNAVGGVIGNIILCSGSGGNCHVWGSTGSRAFLVGNSFFGVSVDVGIGGVVSSNKIKNGDLQLLAFSATNEGTDKSPYYEMLTATGNCIKNGKIVTYGLSNISGNVIAANAESTAITIFKAAANAIADLNPAIVGNFIFGGSVGIQLISPSYQNSRAASSVLITGNRIYQSETSIKIESTWSGCMVTNNLLSGSIVDEGTNNIIRNNSDDTGGSSGGTAGVSTFNGRSGAVRPQTGDYTAAMVGAIPTGSVTAVQAMTQAEYDALATKSASTLYLIKE